MMSRIYLSNSDIGQPEPRVSGPASQRVSQSLANGGNNRFGVMTAEQLHAGRLWRERPRIDHGLRLGRNLTLYRRNSELDYADSDDNCGKRKNADFQDNWQHRRC